MKVVFDAQDLPDEISISLRQTGQLLENLDELKKKGSFDLRPDTDNGVFFMTVDKSVEGGKVGDSHHLYVEDYVVKIDGKQTHSHFQSIDGINIAIIHRSSEIL